MKTNLSLFTIGFTQKSAERFFSLLEEAKVKKLIDTRINAQSQLSGFAKGSDLGFLCKKVLDIPYEHRLELAPTEELLKQVRKKEIDWAEYSRRYEGLLVQRKAETIPPEELDGGCFLCSEHLPEECHRKLLVEYLGRFYPGLIVRHLK